MTIDEAIAALTLARKEAGGGAALLMADGLPVARFPVFVPSPGDQVAACAYVCDTAEG